MPTLDRNDFYENGFGIARGVFSRDEVETLRERFHKIGERSGARDPSCKHLRMPHGDALSMSELRDLYYVILDARILDLVRAILGPDVIYHGDSSIQIGSGPRGFHKDNADRGDPNGIDWQGDYGLIRMGVYLQDHTRHSGGLKVRKNSHRFVSHHTGRAMNLDTSLGDVVFWFLTTSHSGNAVRLRVAPRLCLHPRIESLAPEWLRTPEEAERMALFCTYARPGLHFDRYLQYQQGRQYMREHWARCRWDASAVGQAKRAGIQVLLPSWENPIDNLSAYRGGRANREATV